MQCLRYAFNNDVSQLYAKAGNISGSTYQPIYYFIVNGKDYEWKAKVGSSYYLSEG